MANLSHHQKAFNGGEISPRLKGRSDLDKYDSSLALCRNAIVLPIGGVMKRSGFHYINGAKNDDKYAVLLPFIFSQDQSYVIEAGDLYFRFYMDGGRITTADANTLLLLHADGDDKSIDFPDDGVDDHTVTAYGNCQVDTAEYYFPNGSALFDGSGDYLSIPDHADWNFAGDPLTIDFRIRFYSNTGLSAVWIQKDTTSGDHILLWVDHDENAIHFQVSDGGVVLVNEVGAWAPSVDTWYHVALIRGWGGVADDWQLTIDGATTMNFTNASVLPNHDQPVYLGGNLGNTTVLDYAGRHPAWTAGSVPAITTGAAKFGDGAWHFDGTDDYLQCVDHADWDIVTQANFTVDLWVKHDSMPGAGSYDSYIAQVENDNNHWSLRLKETGGHYYLQFVVVTAAALVVEVISGADVLADTDWHHVAVCKIGNEYGIYCDGVQVAYTNDASTDTYAGVLRIGYKSVANPYVFGGYMEDMRITYANTFSAIPVVGLTDTITVPTIPVSADANTKLLIRGDMSDFYGWLDEIRVSDVARWTTSFTPPASEYPGGGGGTTYEVTTSPYTQHEVQDLTWLQSADTLYLFHPDHNVYKLVRSDHTSWTCTEIDWDQPPWNPQNTTAITLDPSATTGLGIDVVASAPFFSDNHVGAYFFQENGFYRITAVTDSLNAVADVKSDLDNHNAVDTWYQGCWDATQGFPTMGTFHEDRLCLIGDRAHPLNVFLSETGNYENFGEVTSPLVDSDPLNRILWTEGQNRIKWIKSGKKLFMGTQASEFWMTGETIDAAITPTSVLVRKESTTGSEGIMPLMLGDDIIFVQGGARTIRAWSYLADNDGYSGVDLGVLADHFTKDSTIQRMTYAQDPFGIIWMQMSDGYLLGFTYLKAHKVAAWHEHDTGADGIFESICVIPGDYDDELWALVCRQIGGSDVRYIERLDPQFFGGDLTSNDGIFTDSCLTYVGAPGVTFTGMDHLIGETIQVLADGIDIGTKVVDPSGEFTLAVAASFVVAGPGYNTNLQILPPAVTLPSGEQSDKLKRIIRAMFQVYESGNWKVGRDASHLISAGMTSTGATYTGDYVRTFEGDFDYSPSIYIRADAPTPFTLLSIVYPIELEDD